MKQVAKLIIVDGRGKYLLMQRSDHPTFGNDPDLPGGTLEVGESPVEAMVREVFEEVAIAIDRTNVKEIYAGTDYSAHGTHYSLYVTELPNTPEVIMSWEHSLYEWVDRDVFLEKAGSANDTYMRMVYNVLRGA
jgi:8-oxo-dGTP diphosphatase